MENTVSDVIVKQLASWGVEYVFGLPGTSALGLVDALRRSERVRFIQVRHEEVAAFMASAYAKLTGRVGVCLTIAGPGATNLITGLYDAQMDRAPVLALTGQVKLQYLGPGSFQEIDQDALFHPVAGFNKTINAKEQTGELVTLALKHALTEGGVAHLAVPNDVQKEPWDAPAQPWEGSFPAFSVEPPLQALKKAAGLIDSAERPVIIAGWGARKAQEDLLKLARKISAPIATTFRAKGIISEHDPLSLGVLGHTGTQPARQVVNSADLLIVLGSSFSEQTDIPREIPIVQVDIDPMRVAKRFPVRLGLWGDSRLVIPKLVGLVEPRGNRKLVDEVKGLKADWQEGLEKEADPQATPLRPQYIMKLLEDVATPNAIISLDVGDNGFWFGRNFRMGKGQDLLLSGYLGSMGFGLPGALAAKLAQPERQVICLTGDGGFTQVMGDFLTAVKNKLDLTVVLLNNRELAMITTEQKTEGYPKFATELTNPDFAAYARNCGGEGCKVSRPDQLERAVKEALQSPRPALVDIDTEPKRIF